MPEETQETTKTEPAPSKPPSQLEDPNLLVGVLAGRIRATLVDNGPSAESCLLWLKTQKVEVIRKAIVATQPKGWAVASEPLVGSLTDDQCMGLLCSLLAVYVQTL